MLSTMLNTMPLMKLSGSITLKLFMLITSNNLTHQLNIISSMEDLELQVQLLLLPLCKKEEFQIAILSTVMLLEPLLRKLTPMLRTSDKIKLITKKLLTNGELDGLHHQAQLLYLKTQLILITMLLIQVILLLQSKSNTTLKKITELLPLMPKKLLMLGELDLLQAQDN
jgi:hypothetical protein